MAKTKTYRIIHEFAVYSKKNGSQQKRRIVEKNIPTLEEAIELSKTKYGNKEGKTEWRTSGLLFPNQYEIK